MEITPELLERALSRDPAAARDLVARLRPVVQVRVARAVLRSRSVRAQQRDPAEEVRDLAQEVFAYLFANDARVLRAWDPRGLSLRNFVGLVAEQLVARVFRSGKRRPWPESLVDDPNLEALDREAEARGPERDFAAQEYYAVLLERVRDALSPQGYHLFMLLYIEERSTADVCADTGMSADAVYAWRSRLPKLVRKLATALEQEVSAPPEEPRSHLAAKEVRR